MRFELKTTGEIAQTLSRRLRDLRLRKKWKRSTLVFPDPHAIKYMPVLKTTLMHSARHKVREKFSFSLFTWAKVSPVLIYASDRPDREGVIII